MSNSLWSRYKAAINVKQDLHDAFIRTHERYATLDGARAITVLLMVMFHVLFGIVVLFDDNFERVDKFITEFPRYLGWLWQSQGSDPLFVLCGLLVGYTFYREYDRTGTIQIMRFYRRRLMRVMPLFIIAILIYLPTDKDNWEYLWSNLVFLSNYIPGQRHVIPVGWSLDVQMHYYFMLPFLILLMYAIPWRIGFLVALILASFVWRCMVVASDPEVYETPFYQIIYDGEYGSMMANLLYYDIDVRIGTFFLGMLVGYLYYYHSDALKQFFARHVVFNTFLVLLAVVMIVGSLVLPIENKYHSFYDDFSVTINYWFLAMDRYVYSTGLSLLLIMALCGSGIAVWIDKFLSLRFWHPFAQLIFPIYLFHFPFIVVAAVIVFGTTDREAIAVVHTWQVFAIFIVTVILTMAFSALTHVFVEKPCINMREPDGVKDHSAIPNVIPHGDKA